MKVGLEGSEGASHFTEQAITSHLEPRSKALWRVRNVFKSRERVVNAVDLVG
jgi:hypothetical protein